jgi:hypothetical protein
LFLAPNLTVAPTAWLRHSTASKSKSGVIGRSAYLFEEGEFGLTKQCVLKADEVSLYRLSELDRASGLVGVVTPERMREVDAALAFALNLPLLTEANA